MKLDIPAKFYDAIDWMYPEPKLTLPWMSAYANGWIANVSKFANVAAVTVPFRDIWEAAYAMTCARAGVMP